MVKIYVSQPTKGRKLESLQSTQDKIVDFAVRQLKEAVEVINFPSKEPLDQAPVAVLGASLMKIAEADKVYFASGWHEDRICQIQKKTCELFRIPYALLTIK